MNRNSRELLAIEGDMGEHGRGQVALDDLYLLMRAACRAPTLSPDLIDNILERLRTVQGRLDAGRRSLQHERKNA